ncbi:unnamed protein product [Orchesella dallaii]|uniref:Uncharacterized protein n=1 Tax=Orchesella dallaii TaxID=48710 RepID=A0ABP1R5L2_9HEXA
MTWFFRKSQSKSMSSSCAESFLNSLVPASCFTEAETPFEIGPVVSKRLLLDFVGTSCAAVRMKRLRY